MILLENDPGYGLRFRSSITLGGIAGVCTAVSSYSDQAYNKNQVFLWSDFSTPAT